MSNLDKKYKELKQIFIFNLAGSNNIKKIKEIEKMIRLNNRVTRDLISKLKNEIPIVSLSGSRELNSLKGYFYFNGDKNDMKYLEHCINEYKSRIKYFIRTIRVLQKAKETIKHPKEQLYLFNIKKDKEAA